MKMIPGYFRSVVIPLILVIIIFYTPWTSFSNPLPQYIKSKILSPSQETFQHKSNSNSSFFSSSPPQKDPSSLTSLSQQRMNNDIVSVLMGPTLIDGTGDPPKSNTVIIT
ncbi:MAG: hypothetical protein M3270_00070, partial [Thermoproteota archaeon]|nr:hypothetical protein [Thermoproteota archaeon]